MMLLLCCLSFVWLVSSFVCHHVLTWILSLCVSLHASLCVFIVCVFVCPRLSVLHCVCFISMVIPSHCRSHCAYLCYCLLFFCLFVCVQSYNFCRSVLNFFISMTVLVLPKALYKLSKLFSVCFKIFIGINVLVLIETL